MTWFEDELEELKDDPAFVLEGLKLDISEQICNLAKDNDLKLTDIADKAGLSRKSLFNLLRSKSNFSLSALVKVAMALERKVHIEFVKEVSVTFGKREG